MPKINIFKRIFNNPFSAFIIGLALLAAMWIASLFPADYKFAQFLQFAGVSAFMVGLMLVFVWLVWRIRTTYHVSQGVPDTVTGASAVALRCVAYLSVALLMHAAAILSTG